MSDSATSSTATRSDLVFENELFEMTEAFKPMVSLDTGPNTPFYDGGHILFEEVPYGDYRTDIVAVRFDLPQLGRRKRALGHYTPLPDERKYRKSYRRIQQLEPITKHEWVSEVNTYIESTARQTWNWLLEHDYIRQIETQAWGDLQSESSRYVTVRYPDVGTITAFELKQKDWRTALKQASRAAHYAEHSIVVMDAGGAKEALENQHLFRDHGVGLWVMSEDDYEKVVTANLGSTLRTTTRQLVIERALDQADDELFEEAEEYV